MLIALYSGIKLAEINQDFWKAKGFRQGTCKSVQDWCSTELRTVLKLASQFMEQNSHGLVPLPPPMCKYDIS